MAKTDVGTAPCSQATKRVLKSTRAFQHCYCMHPNTAGPGVLWEPGSYNNMLPWCSQIRSPHTYGKLRDSQQTMSRKCP